MQTRKRLVPVARAKTVGLWALGSLSAAGAWDPHLPAEVKVGGWGPSWDVLEDLLWTDPASRIPAPPCLLLSRIPTLGAQPGLLRGTPWLGMMGVRVAFLRHSFSDLHFFNNAVFFLFIFPPVDFSNIPFFTKTIHLSVDSWVASLLGLL